MIPNFDMLALQLTPAALRRPVMNALLRAIMAPFRRLAADHAAFQEEKRRRMNHNGQVRLLERIANLTMVEDYDPADPAIYIGEAVPLEEFLIAPDGAWALQGSIHHDSRAKDDWDWHNPDPCEPPEAFGILHDGSDRSRSLGFEVHLTPPLNPAAQANLLKEAYKRNGGDTALCDTIDTYKLAGKRYSIVHDQTL